MLSRFFNPRVFKTDPHSLKQRMLKGSMWTIAGYGMNQVLRLGSNLVLTRLLFPEAFGLMSLVQVFMQGLEMLSDVGITPSIIHNKKGNEPTFLNTAWTVQLLRGFFLWVCACLLAVPVASFYREPMLTQLLVVAGISAIISGFNSTKLATANRELILGWLTLIELGSYGVSLIVMVSLAWQYHSVWALVVGGIVNALGKMICSHFLLPGENNRLCWEKEALKELGKFGRWIFISTALGFIYGQCDRLLLGRLISIEALGIYTIALTLALLVNQITHQLGSRVLFPSYAQLVREKPEELYKTLKKVRIILLAVTTGIAGFFIIFGEPLINLLYDDRYAEAGWILRVLAAGTMLQAIGQTYGSVVLAKGKPRLMVLLILNGIIVQFSTMFLGAYWGGYHGLVIGVAISNLFSYPVIAWIYARLGVWQPDLDFPVMGLAFAGAAFIYFG
jgi:O-antigen/teichoic acid export membrane protein